MEKEEKEGGEKQRGTMPLFYVLVGKLYIICTEKVSDGQQYLSNILRARGDKKTAFAFG